MFYQITKNEIHTIKNKNDKSWKRTWNNVLFGCKDFTHNFMPQEVKMTNKVLGEKSNCFKSIKIFKTKTQQQQKIIQHFTD